MLTAEQLKEECWNKAYYNLATHYIFRKKSEHYERFIRWNNLLGILTPLSLGATVAAYGIQSNLIGYAIAVAAPLTVIQVLISGFAIVNKWDYLLSYSIESMTANRISYVNFQDLAKYPPQNLDEFSKKYRELSIISGERDVQDEKIKFSQKEDRIGTRYALWIMQKECPECHAIPKNMSPTKCGTCGDPKNYLIYIHKKQ
jgi:mobilome CxxCx(11)CxxC protein